MLKIVALILGLLIAAWGGVIAYRALVLNPNPTAVINEGTGEIKELPNTLRAASGLVMLVGGAGIAFFSLRRKPR